MTKSAPSAIGRCKAGDRKVLSTATFAPTSFAREAIMRISTTRISGLLGVSTSTSFGLRASAAVSAVSLP